jgi:NADPH:quinone reductase
VRAVVTEDYGSAPALAEVPTPTPGPNEVRIKVISASLNGFDNALARGFLRGMMDHQFPIVLGRDFAGTVDELGAGATDFAVGDQVFGVVLTQPLNAGAFGEYLVVPQDHSIGRIPDGMLHDTAGVIGLAGCAATASVDAVHLGEADVALVCGATGGVGAFVLQMAAALGATTIATAAPGAETEHVRSLGATHVVDYTQDLAEQVRAIAPGGVGVAFHFAGDPAVLADLVADGGRFASLLGAAPQPAQGRTMTASSVIASPNRALLESLAADVAAGQLRVPVQRTYALADVPQAFADFAAGTLGKLAVRVDGPAEV